MTKKATAKVNTVLKRKPVDSSTLADCDKRSISQGSVLEFKTSLNERNHTKVTLVDGDVWYLFNDHWNGLQKTFPSGIPMPEIKDNPTKDEVIKAIVAYCKAVGVTKITHIAYVLSTAEGESNFKAIKEIRGKTLTKDQMRYYPSGFYGRGLVQLTWRGNYERVGKILGIDLLGNPDLMLTYPVAIATLVLGLRDGWFTGKKLADYNNYRDMRRIVNPGEITAYPARAQKFVTNAQKWESHLNANKLAYGL